MIEPKAPPVLSPDEIINTAACPQCGAAKGAACSWGKWAGKRKRLHSRRIKPAMRAAGWSRADQERWNLWLPVKYRMADQERLDAHRRKWPQGTPDDNPEVMVVRVGDDGQESWHGWFPGERVASIQVHAESGRFHWRYGHADAETDLDQGFTDRLQDALGEVFACADGEE